MVLSDTKITPNISHPAGDFWRHSPHPLRSFFSPSRVAIIGASERPGSVGQAVLSNLIASPGGATLYPINPNRPAVMGVKAYSNVDQLPQPADLAVIVTPAASVPGIVDQCGTAGIRCAVVISAGFKETGPDGVRLEQELLAAARRHRMRVIGPNCLGVMCPVTNLNATFAHGIAHKGSVGFVSQSGALCTAVLDWSLQEKVGFSAFVSIGSMADVDFGDLIDYLGDDPETHSIVIYMESIGDARSFLSAARQVALSKPIIVIKAGRTDAAAKAAASHTGTLAGSDDAVDAAFRRVGVLRVDSIADLFGMADVLGKQPRPAGRRLTVLTNAGGPGVLATDALIRGGGELTKLSEQTIVELNKILPPQWSHANPVDVLGDADPARYAAALKIAAADPASEGILVILTPQAMTDPTQTAQNLCVACANLTKPVLASWMGGAEVEQGAGLLAQARIPNFAYPDSAARAFNFMWQYTYNLRGIYETPSLASGGENVQQSRASVDGLLQKALVENRTLLTEAEAKEILAAYGIPVAQTLTAGTAQEALAAAKKIGYPVVLKLHSRTITHKTDVGGVKLDLKNADAVTAAFEAIRDSVNQKAGPGHFNGVSVQPMIRGDGYEIILGSTVDPQLGPVILFGAGGQLVEIFKDRALGLPPLTSTLARRMMEQTHIFSAFAGVRGRGPVNKAKLEELIVNFSRLVTQHPRISEIDINPLLVSDKQIIALDARVVLHPASMTDEKLPRTAIRPYPDQYVWRLKTRDGLELNVRPIRPEDEPMMVGFHHRLSEQTVRQRFMGMIGLSERVEHDRLVRRCFNDYDREIALVVEYVDPTEGTQIVGVGRLNKIPGINEASFSMLIEDRLQNRGLGEELFQKMIDLARKENVARLSAQMLASNYPMQHLCAKAGFKLSPPEGDNLVNAVINLGDDQDGSRETGET